MSRDGVFSVLDTFNGKSVLVTGSTGFVGKVLVEKLLRDVIGVEKIFILIRGKFGKNVEERFELLKKSPVFRRVREEYPDAFNKLIPIEADINDPNSLGISAVDIELLRNEISFVFHVAATVKFDEPLDVAIRTNLIGTKILFEMAQSFQKFESFVYVSTAFSNVHAKTVTREIIHDSNFSWEEAIDAVESNNYEKMDHLMTELKNHFPNTYTYSKHLTEKFINEKSSEMPIVILRPSVVTPNMKEPFPGWVDFRGTCIGVQIAIFHGLLKSYYGKKTAILSMVPCDYVINAAIASAAFMAQSGDKKLKIYNCTPELGKRTIGGLINGFAINAREFCPSEKVISYPSLEVHESYFGFLLRFLIYQMLPCFILDLSSLTRKFKFTQLNYKILKSIKELEFFTLNQHEFDDTECLKLSRHFRHEEEKVIFYFGDDIEYNREEYDDNFGLGVRRYVLKENDETISVARRKVKIFGAIKITLQVTVFTAIAVILFKLFS